MGGAIIQQSQATPRGVHDIASDSLWWYAVLVRRRWRCLWMLNSRGEFRATWRCPSMTNWKMWPSIKKEQFTSPAAGGPGREKNPSNTPNCSRKDRKYARNHQASVLHLAVLCQHLTWKLEGTKFGLCKIGNCTNSMPEITETLAHDLSPGWPCFPEGRLQTIYIGHVHHVKLNPPLCDPACPQISANFSWFIGSKQAKLLQKLGY